MSDETRARLNDLLAEIVTNTESAASAYEHGNRVEMYAREDAAVAAQEAVVAMFDEIIARTRAAALEEAARAIERCICRKPCKECRGLQQAADIVRALASARGTGEGTK